VVQSLLYVGANWNFFVKLKNTSWKTWGQKMARSKNLSGGKKNHDLGHWPSPACSLSSYLHNLTGIHTCTSSQMFCIFQRVFYFIDSTITETTTTKSRCSTDPGSQTISNCSGRRNKVMFFQETSFVLLYWFVIVTYLMFINYW
jgi:hypothetical protein